MKKIIPLLLLIGVINVSHAQHHINRAKFFTDTAIVETSLKMNVKKVMANKDIQGRIFPATFLCKIDDSLNVNDQIEIEVRGHFRRAYCDLPPLKLIYKNNESAAFYKLKDLKLVSPCTPARSDDQNLLKEYLIYKMFNLFTEKSFKARLLNISFIDSAAKRKTITVHAFLVENIKEVAKRNNCKDMDEDNLPTRFTNRGQIILASVFEYMIGNTDWSVPGNHNMKLIKPKNDSTAFPFMIPYDFDFSGLVNTAYSAPDPRFGLASVRERLYKGLPIAIDELNPILQQFIKQKQHIYALINNFYLLTPTSKKEMCNYLDEFYDTISNQKKIQNEFVTR